MEAFSYCSPTRIEFGPNKRKEIGALLTGRYKKVLIVLSKGPFRDNGVLDDIEKSLTEASIRYFECSDIDSNPTIASAQEGVEVCKKNVVDCILAIGGGSAMDCGKIIGAATSMNVDPYDLIWGERIPVTSSLPVITVPTLAATGTEINNAAVMVNQKTKEKYWAIVNFPVLAIQDPVLTTTVPLKLTIWGAMDILSHTFEYYFNGYNRSEFQLCFSEALILSIMKTVEALIKDPKDVNARGELMWNSVMAWGGLTKIGQGDPDMACHSIEESFSGYFNTHHGACLGILTPNWMKIACRKAPTEFARFGRRVFQIKDLNDIETAELAVNTYVIWLKSINAPACYDDIVRDTIVIDEKGLNFVAEKAFEIYEGKIGRLFSFTLDEIKDLLKKGMKPYTID